MENLAHLQIVVEKSKILTQILELFVYNVLERIVMKPIERRQKEKTKSVKQ